MGFHTQSILEIIAELKKQRKNLEKPFKMLKDHIEIIDSKIQSYERYYIESEKNVDSDMKWLDKGEEPSIHWGEMSNIELLKKKDETP